MPDSKPNQIELPPITKDLSIIIVSYKRLDCLRKCIQSIVDTVKTNPYEIIIVDNQSDDGTPETIHREFPNLRVIENTENLGFARGNNQGILISGGKYVLLLNNDTEALPEAIDTLIEIMNHSPEVGLLGCRLINPNQTIQQSFGRMLNPVTQLGQKLCANKIYANPGNPMAKSLLTQWHSVEKDVDWIRGACMMLRREALVQVGLMDEQFFMFLEDVDLGAQIRKAGWKVRFTPKASIVHHEGASISKNFLKSALEFRRSQLYFYKKYYGQPGLAGLKLFLLCKFFKNLVMSRLVSGFSSVGDEKSEEATLEKLNREVLNLLRNYK